MDFNKYLFAAVAIVSLAGLQVAAWYLGHDGQISMFIFTAIGGIIGFITGLKINFSPAKQG